MNNLWADITRVSLKERTGYPTQKPLALLERIIQASSNPGDIALDPFCGCGTATDAAANLGRKYLGIDISAIAVRVMEQRLRSRSEAVSPSVYGLEWSDYDWEEFERRALMQRDDAEDGTPGWAWAEDRVAGLLNAVPNAKKTGAGGVDARYYGAASEVIPIQIKMHRKPVGRPDMDKLLGAQTAMRNRGIHAPMSLMVSLYPPPRNLRVFATEQGRIPLNGDDYPIMQVLSVEEMLTAGERPKLPPVDPPLPGRLDTNSYGVRRVAMESYEVLDRLIRLTGRTHVIERWERYCRQAFDNLKIEVEAGRVDLNDPAAIAGMFQACLNDLVDPTEFF